MAYIFNLLQLSCEPNMFGHMVLEHRCLGTLCRMGISPSHCGSIKWTCFQRQRSYVAARVAKMLLQVGKNMLQRKFTNSSQRTSVLLTLTVLVTRICWEPQPNPEIRTRWTSHFHTSFYGLFLRGL